MSNRLIFFAPFFLAIFGCHTPQVALDEASNGAALTASLESELREYRRVQAEIASQRIALVRGLRETLAETESTFAFDDRILEASGKTAHLSLYRALRTLADSRAKDEETFQAKMKELDASLAKLVAPLPDSSEKLKATEAALGAMATELSSSDRIKTVADFSRAVKKTVDENREKIKKAEEAAKANTPSANNP